MYFTIPANSLGAGNPASNTDVYMDNGVSLDYTPTTLKYSFGEGYSLVLPTGPEKRSFSATMANRTKTEIDLIAGYFKLREGNVLNNFNILGSAAFIRVKEYTVTWTNAQIGSVSANFEEVP